jgi:hypothetical protein
MNGMKTTLGVLGFALGLVLLGQPTIVFAQQEEGEGAAKIDRGSAESRERSEAREASDMRRLMSRFSKLRTYMNDKLKLDTEQKREITELFENHMRDLTKVQSGKQGTGSKEDQDRRLAELQKEIDTAREAEDHDFVRELRDEMRAILVERRSQTGRNTQEFLKKLEAVLFEDQIPEFKKILQRLGFALGEQAQVEGSRESLEQLLRAVMDPSVGLTQEKKQAVVEVMREAILSLDPDMDRNAFVAELSARLQTEIVGVLDDDQWKKVETIMEGKPSEAPKTP